MRRIILSLMLMALVAFAGGAGNAVAAPGQTFQFHLNGSFAEAQWQTQTTNSITDTFVSAGHNQPSATFLVFDEFTTTFDNSGNITGHTDVSGAVNSGVSFSIVNPLASAAASASVPATSCSYDANFNLIGCVDVGTVDVSASWTGQGPIARGTFNSNFRVDGFHEISHFTGSNREATATATLDGTSLGTGDLIFANIGTAKSGNLTVCHNC
jgi:hypothetical protein